MQSRLANGPCQSFGPNVKIVALGQVRYPDVVVACTPQRGSSTVIDAAVVVFEVVSISSSRTDRIDKPREYLEFGSIQRYVILEQDSVAATVFQRDGHAWKAATHTAGDMLDMPEIGVELPLAECYLGVDPTGPTDPETR